MPEQVLNLNLPSLQAVIEGYQEHLFDLKCISVYQGFWAGYYSNSKHPKPLGTVLNQLLREHKKAKKQNSRNQMQKPKPDVDVAAFLEREKRFKAKQVKVKGVK